MTDVVLGTLYGDVFQLDAATGTNRHGANPLFRFSTDYHPIGAVPAIYSNGGAQYAVVVSGGYADQQVTSWSFSSPPMTSQRKPRIGGVRLSFRYLRRKPASVTRRSQCLETAAARTRLAGLSGGTSDAATAPRRKQTGDAL